VLFRSLGIELSDVSVDGVKTCRNKCVFCFVEQMPPGMRSSLYEKDDDFRLSATKGSFITLSNLTEAEFGRLLRERISPLYISVHAWDPELRERLMTYRGTRQLPVQIAALSEAGIEMHTQIVVVPGYNDGAALDETVRALAALRGVSSIGVVPVGLTAQREGLPVLSPVNSAGAHTILAAGHRLQEEFLTRCGRRRVFYADEFYMLAGLDLPPAEAYEGFPQLENGIGLWAKFQSEIDWTWGKMRESLQTEGSSASRLHIVTGVLTGAHIRRLTAELQKVPGLPELVVHAVPNHTFGGSVTVTGLLTAGDIAAALGDVHGDTVLLPDVLLREQDAVFLDDRDVAWLAEHLGGRVEVVPTRGESFLNAVFARQQS
jgi:putative radical SAM enzyme (TIGR03279 family)